MQNAQKNKKEEDFYTQHLFISFYLVNCFQTQYELYLFQQHPKNNFSTKREFQKKPNDIAQILESPKSSCVEGFIPSLSCCWETVEFLRSEAQPSKVLVPSHPGTESSETGTSQVQGQPELNIMMLFFSQFILIFKVCGLVVGLRRSSLEGICGTQGILTPPPNLSLPTLGLVVLFHCVLPPCCSDSTQAQGNRPIQL